MKKLFKLFVQLNIFFATFVSAHDQDMHQHITKEAFKLLQYSFPGQLTEMANYIGTNETSGSGALISLGAGKIVAGAWMEDEYDIVYHYGIGNEPDYYQTLPNNFILDIFGSQRKAHTSITHFWDSDDGNWGKTSNVFLSDWASGIYWSFSINENAYKKSLLYKNGGFNLRYFFNQTVPVPVTAILCAAYDFEYNSLKDLYQNGYYTIKKYLSIGGYWLDISLPQYQMGVTSRKIIVIIF